MCFYKDPERHARRKYIGVVFEREMQLPMPRNKPRIRRLGLVGREREMGTLAAAPAGEVEGQGTPRQRDRGPRAKVPEMKKLELSSGYQYRESNWSIGRTAERANVRVREYKRGDRFLAWRKLNARKARNAEKRALSSRKKKGSKNKR